MKRRLNHSNDKKKTCKFSNRSCVWQMTTPFNHTKHQSNPPKKSDFLICGFSGKAPIVKIFDHVRKFDTLNEGPCSYLTLVGKDDENWGIGSTLGRPRTLLNQNSPAFFRWCQVECGKFNIENLIRKKFGHVLISMPGNDVALIMVNSLWLCSIMGLFIWALHWIFFYSRVFQ